MRGCEGNGVCVASHSRLPQAAIKLLLVAAREIKAALVEFSGGDEKVSATGVFVRDGPPLLHWTGKQLWWSPIVFFKCITISRHTAGIRMSVFADRRGIWPAAIQTSATQIPFHRQGKALVHAKVVEEEFEYDRTRQQQWRDMACSGKRHRLGVPFQNQTCTDSRASPRSQLPANDT